MLNWLHSLLNWLSTWLPPYTEQWATTYIQVLFQSFLFALGVPTAIYSLIIDNDIKRVAQTRVKVRKYFWGTGGLYVAVFVIVWFIHPDPQPPPLQPQWVPIAKSLFTAATVTILPLGVLLLGFRLNRKFRRTEVVKRLADELLKRLDDDRNIDTVALSDLSYLGEYGHAGDEKEIVLDVINNLVEIVQKKVKTRELNYNGYELESLIRHIPAMLDNNSQPGNDRNYRRAVEVLSNIWRWLSKRKVTDDALSTREALTHLALQSVEKTAEETALAYLEIAADCDSHMVFDMGLAAIRAKKYPLAVAALSKLEAMASNAVVNKLDREVSREARANLLGITAHLAADGPSAACRAESAINLNEELFSPSLRSALTDAYDYHYSASRFDIADKILLFIDEANKMKTIDLDRKVLSIVTP
jgi:hypothetical protein